MISKKSILFGRWLQKGWIDEPPKELIDLEQAARLAVHDLDTMGEITEKSLRALARASKAVEAEYVKDQSG